MTKLIFLCLSIIGLLVGCNKADVNTVEGKLSKACEMANIKNGESDLYIQPHQRIQVIAGSDSVRSFVAPSSECIDSRRTVKTGILVYLEKLSKDHKFALVSLSGMPGEEDEKKIVWIESSKLEEVVANPNRLSCEVHPETTVESECKWSPPTPKSVAELNDEQAYCDQKERAEFEKTHKLQSYFLVETKGRTPLYSLPDEQCKSKKFLVQGDLVDLIQFYPNEDFGGSKYARIIYYSDALKRDVVGWVPSNSLCRLTASGGNCEHVKRR